MTRAEKLTASRTAKGIAERFRRRKVAAPKRGDIEIDGGDDSCRFVVLNFRGSKMRFACHCPQDAAYLVHALADAFCLHTKYLSAFNRAHPDDPDAWPSRVAGGTP